MEAAKRVAKREEIHPEISRIPPISTMQQAGKAWLLRNTLATSHLRRNTVTFSHSDGTFQKTMIVFPGLRQKIAEKGGLEKIKATGIERCRPECGPLLCSPLIHPSRLCRPARDENYDDNIPDVKCVPYNSCYPIDRPICAPDIPNIKK